MSMAVRRPGKPLINEFRRISRLAQNRWDKASYGEERRLEGIFVGYSVVHEFGKRYGRDPKKIVGWQRLCRDLGFRKVPQTIEQCNAVSTRFYNVLECSAQYFSTSRLDLNFWSGRCSVYTDVDQKKFLRQYRSTDRGTEPEEEEEGDNI